MQKASHLSSETKPGHAKISCFDHKIVRHVVTNYFNSVLMNLFSIEIVYLFPEVTVGVVK